MTMAEQDPVYASQTIEPIPAMQTPEGHKMRVQYSTVVNKRGFLDFEIAMSLETPLQADRQVMMLWFQMLDPEETELSDGKKFYESLSCSLLYKAGELDKGIHI